jgi:hypothetical protein
MPKFTLWTNATQEKTVRAHGFQEAIAKYHEEVGEMPQTWNGELHVKSEDGEERTFRRREAA